MILQNPLLQILDLWFFLAMLIVANIKQVISERQPEYPFSEKGKQRSNQIEPFSGKKQI